MEDSTAKSGLHFEKITKTVIAQKMAYDTIRVGKRSLSMATNVAQQFTDREDRKNGTAVIRVGFEVDRINNAIRIYEDRKGFRYTCKQPFETTGAIGGIPAGMRKLDLKRGSYRFIPDLDAFVLSAE
jgi:hypothetical protein